MVEAYMESLFASGWFTNLSEDVEDIRHRLNH